MPKNDKYFLPFAIYKIKKVAILTFENHLQE